MPDSSPQLDQRGAALALAVLSTVAKTADARLKAGRDIAATNYFTAGDSLVVRDPETGAKLGKAWMTSPSPAATVTDRDAFILWQADQDPGSVEVVRTVPDEHYDEAMAVLKQHAPHLLSADVQVKGWAQEAALKAAAAPNADLIPGVEVRTPRGSITVKLDDGGAERIRELVSRGRVDPLAELPSASAQDGAA